MDPNRQNPPMEGYDFDENMPVPHPSVYPTTGTEQQPLDSGPLVYGAGAPQHLQADDYLATQQQQQHFEAQAHHSAYGPPQMQQHHLHYQQPQHVQPQQHYEQHHFEHHHQQHLEHSQQPIYQQTLQDCPTQDTYDYYGDQYMSTAASYDATDRATMDGPQQPSGACVQPAGSLDTTPPDQSFDPYQFLSHEHLTTAAPPTSTSMEWIDETDLLQHHHHQQPQQLPLEPTTTRYERLINSLRQLEKQALSNGEMLNQICQHQEEYVIKGQDRAKAISRRTELQERGDYNRSERFKAEVSQLEVVLRQMGRELREKKGRLWQRFMDVFKKVSQHQSLLLFQYLPEWQLNQQISQNGTEVDNFKLDQIQQCCESVTDIIWRTRNQLRAFHLFLRNIGCSQTASDQVNKLGFAINRAIETLILNTLVVEKQPPQVMKKNTRFSTTVRLLCGPKLNINLIHPTLKVDILSEHNARLIKIRHKELIGQSWAFLDNQPSQADMQAGPSHYSTAPAPQQPASPEYLHYGRPESEQKVYDYQHMSMPPPPCPPPQQPNVQQQQRQQPPPPQQHSHRPSSGFNQSKILNMRDFEPSGELLNSSSLLQFNEITRQVCSNFRNMQLKSIKRHKAEKKGTESVLEEKFLLLFHSQFRIAESLSASDSEFGASFGPPGQSNPGLLPWMSQGDMTFHMMSFSLPVVVIVHGSQESDANATISWHNAFARPDHILYKVADRVTWPELAQMLSDKFRSGAGLGLSEEQLRYLSTKVARKKAKPEESAEQQSAPADQPQWVTWNQFSKDKIQMSDRGFTFWEWFHSALKLTREDLRDLWVGGRIYGFASKNDCSNLLLGNSTYPARPKGTFLLRFSETELGGITIAWVTSSSRQIDEEGYMETGQRCSPSSSPSTVLQHVRPLGSKDLQTKRLADRLRDVKDLLYLYPDIPKDEAFNEHYTPACSAPQPPEGYVDSELVQKFGPPSY